MLVSNTTIRTASLTRIALVAKEASQAATDCDAASKLPHACPVASQLMKAMRPARNRPRINVAVSFAELEHDAAQVVASALSSSGTGISRRDELDEFQLRMIEQAALSLCAHCIKQTLVTGAAGGPVPSHLVLPDALQVAVGYLRSLRSKSEGSEQTLPRATKWASHVT
jgi:hypothetical protein